MKRFEDIVSENELILLRYYNDSLTKIKQQLLNAAVQGYDKTHLQQLQENVENELNKLQKKFQFYSTEQTSKVYKQGVKGAEASFRQLHIQFNPVKARTYAQFSGLHKNAVKTLAINTYKPLQRVVDVIGRDCIEYFERTNFNSTQDILKKLLKFFPDNEDLRSTGLASVQGVVNGNITWQKAIRDFQEEFMKDSIFKVPYYKKDGTLHAMVDLQGYAELVARTTSAEAYRKGAETTILETFDDMGDLVQVNGHSKFPNSPCLPFEDAFLSLTGKTKGYTTLDEAKAQGLFHPNCIHHFAVTTEVIEEYERIEAGKGQGTVLKEVDKPPTKQRAKTDENEAGWSMADILKGYIGNDELVKDAFSNAFIDEETAEILANIHKLPAVRIVNDKGRGYFSNAQSLISADNAMTFLHEFGHSLDYGLVKASSTTYGYYSKKLQGIVESSRIKRLDKFPEEISSKFKDIKNTYKLENGVFDYKKARKDGWAALSDIYDALTNGNMYDKASFTISGHGSRYYRQHSTKEKEIFAQYFFLRTNNCQEALKVLKQNKPELLNSLEELFTMYVKDIKNL